VAGLNNNKEFYTAWKASRQCEYHGVENAQSNMHGTVVIRRNSEPNGVFTQSSKCPANFQQMYSKYTC